MPLKFSWQKLPVDENGKSYDSLEAFQVAKLAEVLHMGEDVSEVNEKDVGYANQIMAHKSEVLELITLNTSARPAARGVPKKRRIKPTDAQLPLKENAA